MQNIGVPHITDAVNWCTASWTSFSHFASCFFLPFLKQRSNSAIYITCSIVHIKEVKDLEDLCDATSVTTMVPQFTLLFSVVLRFLYHHHFYSVIFHTGFSVECLLPALVSVLQMSFYCWSLFCLSTCLCGCPLTSQSYHATWYYFVTLPSSNICFPLLMSARRSAFNGEHLASISSVCYSFCSLFLPVSPAHFPFWQV